MSTAKSHINKSLVSVTNGKVVGEIKDLYVDRDLRQVAAVHLGSAGLMKRKARILARGAVQVFGEDAWLVTGPDKVTGSKAVPDADSFLLVGDLRGREIETEGGTKVGVVEDVILDAQARVVGFVLGKTYVHGPLARRKTIARDAVIKLGGKDAPMTVELTQAENLPVPM